MDYKITRAAQFFLSAILCVISFAVVCRAQTTAFTYQGRLIDASNPADGLFDMQFKLFNTADVGTGTQLGVVTNSSVQVTNGTFSVELNFSPCASCFDGSARFLEISLRPTGSPAARTTLSPRQPITSTPYALHSLTAANAMQLSGMNPTSFVQFNGSGNVGVGTSMPLHRLAISGGPAWTTDGWGGAVELGNAAAIGWRANSSGTRFGIGRTNTGMFFFHTNSELGASTNGPVYSFKMDNSGSIGIGDIGINTDLTGAKLNIFTSILGFGYGLAHTNGTVTVGTYVDSSGGWLGTRSNHPLHFFTNDGLPKMTLGTSSNVGIGTTIPISKLDVRGNLTLEAGDSPVLYTSTASTEQNRYLQLINSFNSPSASGLKAGGVLVADSYGFANPGKNDLIVKGKVGIGTATPVGKLHVIGSGGGSIGVWGEGGSGASQGVHGKGFYGVFGKSTDANGYGVYGEPPDNCVGNCWAAFFNGHVRIGAGADLFVDSDGDFARVFAIEFIETSDRNAKANFASVDTRSILERLASVPIQSWNFKGQPETVRHIGPMAQDFRAAFNLGTDDKHISTVDADGVALAAIQGLYRLVQEKEKQLERLQTRVARLERRAKNRRQGRIAASR